MGTSTNAVLFYGYCWEEEGIKLWAKEDEPDEDEADESEDVDDDESEDSDDSDRDESDWEVRYARLSGLLPPDEPFPEGVRQRGGGGGWGTPKYTPEEQAIVDKYSAFWDKKRELIERSGVEIDSHCSGDCPIPLIAITASITTAHRGDAVEIKSLDVGPKWDEQLKAFCKLMGIKTKGKPRWWLVSYWG